MEEEILMLKKRNNVPCADPPHSRRRRGGPGPGGRYRNPHPSRTHIPPLLPPDAATDVGGYGVATLSSRWAVVDQNPSRMRIQGYPPVLLDG